MRQKLLFLILLLLPFYAMSQWTQVGADINGAAPADLGGISAINGDGTRLVVGSVGNDSAGNNAGHVRVFEFDGTNWVQLGSAIEGDAVTDNMGAGVAINNDGSVIAVGAPNHDGLAGADTGQVKVYQFDGTNWVQLGAEIEGEGAGDGAGRAISLSDDGQILAIGAELNDGGALDTGHARIYSFDGNSWNQLGSDLDGPGVNNLFGSAVSLSSDGTIIAVGARQAGPTDAGLVFVFEYDGLAWNLLGSAIGGIGTAFERFGRAVSLNGNGTIVAIGAPSGNAGSGTNSGYAQIYEYNGTTWLQVGATIPAESADDQFGQSLDISADGNTVAIAAIGNDDNGTDAGEVSVLDFAGGAWTEIIQDLPGEAAGDLSGRSVSIYSDGFGVAIGSQFNDGNGPNSGHVRVFDCRPPDVPIIDPNSSCSAGSTVTITFSGNLNSATAWHVYTSSCGGTLVGTTTTNSFDVAPTVNTTYFIRAEGGCITTPGNCESIAVTIGDSTPPNVLCMDTTVQLDPNGIVFITANDVDAGTTDNCGLNTLFLDTLFFECSNIGVNQVTLTATDNDGNSASCTANVTVEDSAAPIVACQDITVQLDSSGMATISGNDLDAGSTDNCGVTSLSLDVTTFSCSNIGVNAVTLTAMDGSGNSASCVASVTVEDIATPVMLCQDITVQLDGNGTAVITANDVDNGSFDNCQIDILSISTSTFECGDIGVNPVTLSAIDVNGNIDSCVANVTVEDSLPPAVSCNDITVQLDNNGMVSIVPNDVDNGTTDNCGVASLTLDISTFDCSDIGVNVITLTALDVNGNSSSCTASVTVEDTIAPTAVCQDITVQLDSAGTALLLANDVDSGSSDNCQLDSLSLDITSFDCSTIGVNNVILTVTDDSGNSSSCTAMVTVEDALDPTLVCPPDQTVGVNSSLQYEVEDYFGLGQASASDNCSVATTTQDPAVGTLLPDGTYTVTLTATDTSGNSNTCTFELTVDETLGLEDFGRISPFIFPNPTSTDFIIQGMESPKSISIYNLAGQQVKTFKYTTENTSYDVSNLPSGVYFVEVISEEKRLFRLIKE